jgi:ketosteroid isomerase-like protein
MILTAENVRAEVTRFWNAFTSKSIDALEDFYAHQSSVFGSVSNRPEPGRLAAKRREREYFQAESLLRYQLGNVDVVLLSDASAVACYTFQFHATKLSGSAKRIEEHIGNGRATQVFAFDPADQKIRIYHEHLSVPGLP